MKIIAINLTDIDQSDYIARLSTILNTEIITLTYKSIDPNITGDLYTKLSLGAMTLERYVIDHIEYNSPDKPFVNALMFWNSSLDKVEKLSPYIDMLIKNWFIVQDQNNPNWIFGNITTLTKWAGSLYKLNKSDFYYEHSYITTELTPSLVYAGRIGLNVQGFI